MNPFVSVITPTYNRRMFIPTLIQLYESQTYNHSRMEWIVYDDGTEKVGDLFAAASKRIPNIRYCSFDTKMSIGQKRNLMNKAAKGEIIVAMDDDDFYPPCRVSHIVSKFAQYPRVDLAGSSEMHIFFTDTGKIHKVGPYGPNHATNGTMAWRKRYSDTHVHDETVIYGEELSFLDSYKNPMIQLDPMKVILVFSHSDNTYDKKKLRDPANKKICETGLKIKSFIKDKKIREFFNGLHCDANLTNL